MKSGTVFLLLNLVQDILKNLRAKFYLCVGKKTGQVVLVTLRLSYKTRSYSYFPVYDKTGSMGIF